MKTEPNEPIDAIVETNHNRVTGESYLEARHNGLTKREYFAALAMQGIVSDSNYGGGNAETCSVAVNMADALIEALNK